MNERIDELMIQAGARFEFLHGVHYDDFQYRKFAELIVGECIRKIEDIAESSNDPQPIYRVAVELLEHFGVEE